MYQEATIQLQIVQGGFILTTYTAHEQQTEVFTSQGKLMKAIRAVIDTNELCVKEPGSREDEFQETK